jgi:hypothetical protein
VTVTVPFSCPKTVAANSDRVMLKKRAATATERREYFTPFQAEVAATEGSSRGGSNREAHRFGVSFTAVSNASGICVNPLFYLCSGLRGPLMASQDSSRSRAFPTKIIFLPMSSQELRWDTPKAISLWFLVNRMQSASSFNVPSM